MRDDFISGTFSAFQILSAQVKLSVRVLVSDTLASSLCGSAQHAQKSFYILSVVGEEKAKFVGCTHTHIHDHAHANTTNNAKLVMMKLRLTQPFQGTENSKGYKQLAEICMP